MAAILDVTPRTLVFTTLVGLTPASQSVQIRNVGTGSLKWSVTGASATWLRIQPMRGTNTGAVFVTCASATLPIGVHAASFAVSGAGATRTIAVEVTVTGVVTQPDVEPAPVTNVELRS